MQIYLWLSLARALRSGRRGREFESRQVDHELFAFRCGEWMRAYRVHIAVGTINAIFAWDTARKQRSRFLSLKIASILFAIGAIFFAGNDRLETDFASKRISYILLIFRFENI